MSAVEQAYAEVERITRREAKNFAYGIMVLPRPKRRAIAAIYAFARRGRRRRRRRRSRSTRSARASRRCAPRSTTARRRADVRRARRRARALRDPAQALHDLVDGGLQDTSSRATPTSTSCAATARTSRARSASPASPSTAPTTAAGGDARHRAAADQHHPRRARGLGARPRLPAAGRARRVRRRRGRHRGGAVTPEWQALMASQAARAREYLARGPAPARLARPPQRALRRHLRRPLPCDARPDRGARLRRLRGPPRLSAPAKLAVGRLA